jgi:hypothetical protein
MEPARKAPDAIPRELRFPAFRLGMPEPEEILARVVKDSPEEMAAAAPRGNRV